MAWGATKTNVMFPHRQHYIHDTQADRSGGGLSFPRDNTGFYLQVITHWLVNPAAPGTSRLQGTNNELEVIFSAAAQASP